jgi:Holliday junction resolvasome RuvABC ATP-dependent DNA helicase subunit
MRGARVLNASISADGADEIARRARGTPRIAGRLLRRVRDFAWVADAPQIDAVLAGKALDALEVDNEGLDALDRATSPVSRKRMTADRSGSRRLRRPCRSRATPSRRSSSRICCSRASSGARRAGASSH